MDTARPAETPRLVQLTGHARMSTHGILVLHYAPRRIRTDAAGVVGELRAAIEAGRQRPALTIRAVPAR
jgi:hypothetical protein